MSKKHSFRIPHLTHKHFDELNHVAEDNIKLMAELKVGLIQEKINKAVEWDRLSSLEVQKLHAELWEAYQQMLRWIGVAAILDVELGTIKYVQSILDRLWELLKTNPCTDKLPLTEESIATYKEEVDKGFYPRSI